MVGERRRGRGKIELKKIENEEDLFSTFSKRKGSIYKKASELVTLCGAQVGFVIYSPAGTPFSFGHPSFKTIANEFLGRDPPENDQPNPLLEENRLARIQELTQKMDNLMTRLDQAKKREKELLNLSKNTKKKGKSIINLDVDKIDSLEELKQTVASLEELYPKLCAQFQEPSTSTRDDTPAEVTNPPPADAAATATPHINPNAAVPPGLIN
ncbi:putative mads box protein [Tripterygium wilfordii]|uniref:Putative mads box protein n=1 Tax=Tripterygium wilfordii TaxID=458696 RepID=A0A7J7CRG5_TRIWF|nr:agamous-like MADS-box protein AGL62 [Tripterygium wilfordii]KAF5736651.1 putative mads box protein [Tripterygium wilfordii]